MSGKINSAYLKAVSGVIGPSGRLIEVYFNQNTTGSTAVSTWTKPAGCTQIVVFVTGSGGCGQGQYNSNGSGGGAGGTAIKMMSSGFGNTETVSLGGRGSGGYGGTGNI